MTTTIVLKDTLPRDATAAPCPCGGYADPVDCTKEEIGGALNCGRSDACCIKAFICRICKQRLVAGLAAPEMY